LSRSQRVQLHPEGPEVSKTTAGLMRLNEWEFTSNELLEWIQACIDLGVTTFDHADIYGSYTCEQIFGEAIRIRPGIRQQMELITKCGIQLISENRPGTRVKHYNTSAEHIQKSVERSLKNLHTDYIDVLLIHRPDPLMNPNETAEALSGLIKSGKVKHVGVSNFTPTQFEMLQSRLDIPLVTNQVQFSVLHPQPMFDGTFDQAWLHNIAPMIWSPLGSGSIFNPEDETTHRLHSVLKKLLGKYSCGIDQMALAWIHRHPLNHAVVLGTGKKERIAAAVSAEGIVLELQDWFAILEAARGERVP